MDSTFNNESIMRTTSESEQATVDFVLKSLNKDFGKGTIGTLAGTEIEPCPTISTGSLGLDLATGVGGIPRGRIIEIFGPESSGKTTLTLQMIAEAQKRGGRCAFIDAEHALDIEYAQKLGVDTDNLVLHQPDWGEMGLSVTERLTSTGVFDLIVIDSVANLVPKAELEADMGKSLPGLQARLMAQACRKLTGLAEKSNTTIIFVNQIRYKIGVMFGSPETTPGGNALKFYCSMRLDIRRIGKLQLEGEFSGNRTKVTVVKNKVAPPFRKAEFNIMFGEGVDQEEELVTLAVDNKILKKSGSWFSYNGDNVGQGTEKVKALFRSQPELREEIRAKVYATLFPVEEVIDVEEEVSPTGS